MRSQILHCLVTMIAPTSSGAKTNSGMSGWPVDRPSASASARPSILYLRESVRKGGAAGCGLVPERPTAWQRAQFVASKNSPRPAGVVVSCAKTGAKTGPVTFKVIITTR